VITPDDDPSSAALNVLLGSVGVRGGIVRNSGAQRTASVPGVPVEKARALILDGSVPWDFVPETDAEVFRFAAWDGGPIKADWLLPAPGFLEELTDVPTAPTSSMELYAVAPNLVKPLSDVQSAAQFLTSLDQNLKTVGEIIDARCEDLLRHGNGVVHGLETTPVKHFDSVQKLKEQLWNGAVWVGPPLSPGNLPCELTPWPDNTGANRATACAREWRAPVMPTLATKLYQESNLREWPDGRTA
jgi:hypothetical protein